MVSASDLHGLIGMMPAFTTEDGWDPRAKNTINVSEGGAQRGPGNPGRHE